MKTIADLGRLIKKKYPEYEDLSDEEVGRLAKQKYPEYSDFEDTSAQKYEPPPPPRPETPKAVRYAQNLQDKYDPESGRLWSWWERGKSESRTLTQQQHTREIDSITSSILAGENLNEAVRNSEVSKERFDRQYEIETWTHEIQKARVELEARMVAGAVMSNLPVEQYMEMRRLQMLDGIQLDRIAREYQIKMSAAVQSKKAVELVEYELIQQRLDSLYFNVWELLNGPNKELEYTQRMVKSREKQIRGLERRLSGYLQGDSRKSSRRGVETSDPSGELRQEPDKPETG